MVRVAGRIRRMATGLPVEGASGLAARADPRQHPGNRPRAEPPARRVLRQHGPARPGRAGHRDPALEGAVRHRAGGPAPAVPGADLPGADAAAGGPGPPVPLHLRPVAQPGGDDRRRAHRRDHVRQGQGAAAAAQVPHRGQAPVRAAGRRDRRAPHRAVRRPGHPGAPRVPGHPHPRPGGGRGRHRGPDAVPGTGTAEAPVRARGPAGGGGLHLQRRAGQAGHRAGHRPPRGLPPARAAGPVRPERDRRPGPAAAEVPGVRARRSRPCRRTPTSSPRSPGRTCWSTTPTTRSPPRWNG